MLDSTTAPAAMVNPYGLQIERLQVLADHLRGLAPIIKSKFNPGGDIFCMTVGYAPHECGTTACVAGWALHLMYKRENLPVPYVVQRGDWARISAGAVCELGLEKDAARYVTGGDRAGVYPGFDDSWGHPLFVPAFAGRYCQSVHAADAIECVIVGDLPWQETANT